MPRPNIVRADTLDLQNHENPVAQNHTEVLTVNGYGASQSQAIRSAAEDQAQAQGGLHHQPMGKQEEDELERELADAEVAGDEGGFDDDDLMDKMSSSPSIADEDIDFEMVYALHTFNASVEGQANAAKGEHMVLLDDSNSYWWLVRIVRDSSIGYLPAEHIETPMERLARLNKHRNIDLAANMLSDNTNEKSKNPLKKAMRRRNMKTVAFTSPTYFSASEYECTTDEEGDDYFDEDAEQAAEEADEAETATAGDEKVNGAASAKDDKSTRLAVNGITPSEHGAEVRSSSDIRTSEDGSKLRANPADPLTYHDERQGTKKLTLTPGILRDDVRTGSPTKEAGKARPSLERKEQLQPKREDLVTSPPPKEGKKLKKGSSVLGSLFKKRSKKGKKEEDEDVEEWLHGNEKPSIDSSRSSESSGRDRQGSQSSRLDVDISKREAEDAQRAEEQKRQQEKQQQQERQRLQMQQQQREQELQRQNAQQQQQSNSIRRVDSDDKKMSPISQQGSTPIDGSLNSSVAPQGSLTRSPVEKKKSLEQELRPQALGEQARSPGGDRRNVQGGLRQQHQPIARKMSDDKPNVYRSQQEHQAHRGIVERLSESPEHITYHDATDRPDLLVDTSSGNETSSPIDSSPELIDSRFENTTSPTATVTPAPAEHLRGHTITRTWSDWSLKTYLEDDNDVRDMLIVVQQDKGEVIPPKNHPEIMPLFENSSRRLADITQQLDGMLGEWLQRRAAA